jgi:DNA repair photolyase
LPLPNSEEKAKLKDMALVGIARLASESPLLEAKRAVQYFEIPTRSILNRTKPNMPFRWTINPYRGCEFGCKYCYARYTHEFMEMEADDFEDKIYAKSAAAHLLRQELAKVDRRDGIAIGTATDPYQPAERRYGRTREILEVLARDRGRHIGLITKSDLVVRDIDVMRQIAKANIFGVHLTITTLDADLARLLEPRAPRPDLRLAAVRKLADAGVVVGVNPNPIMPGITDSERALDRLAKASRDAGAVTFGGGPLFLMPSAQKVFFPFLEREFPHLLERYRDLYAKSAYLGQDYKGELAARVRRIRDRYGLASGRIEYKPDVWVEEQGELFD